MLSKLDTVAALVLLLGGASSCGIDSERSSLNEVSKPRMILDYADWCSGWRMECPAAAPVDGQLTLGQSMALQGAANAVLGGEFAVTIPRELIQGKELVQLGATLGLTPEINALRSLWNQVGVNRISVSRGHGQVESAGSSFVDFGHGVQFEIESNLSFRVHSTQTETSGLMLKSGQGSESINVRALVPSGEATSEWYSDRGFRLTNVPDSFVRSNLLGLPPAPADKSKSDEYDGSRSVLGLISAKTAGFEWGGTISKSQLAELSAFLKNFSASARGDAPDVELGQIILAAANSVVLSSARMNGNLASVALNRELHCEIPDKAEVVFESNFGLTSIENLGGIDVRIDVYGVRVRPARGLVRPWFRLNRMDLVKDAIVIRDVPVLKTFTIEVDRDKSKKIRCN